ncbi:MAG: helix-turn-helix transcriptional regulator [Clostridia bacterium]|nr:helix-turn-helix transcriptional regulator [Clostridia bacterium]
MKDIDIKDILDRIGYARNKANLSAREVSLQMGMSPQYVAKLENKNIVLTVEKLLEILTICEFKVEKFFYSNPDEYDIDKELLDLIKSLPYDKKKNIIEFIKS